MADKRTATWHMMDADWVVHFWQADGGHAGYADNYRTSDFDDVQAVVDAWVNDGKLPGDRVEESDTYNEYRDSYVFNNYE